MSQSILLLTTIGTMTMASAPDPPWPEHPRPDLQRSAWVSLNGPWRFDFDPKNLGEQEKWYTPGGHDYSRRITVPFPWESRLSGIADTEYRGAAWYSRKVKLPDGPQWQGRDAWLVVGACDWEAKVWVNGQPAAEHVGGYVPFDVKLSKFARPGETVEIVIRAVDTTNDQQPTGKQVGWYTRTSGIWQTVYIEARSRSYVRAFRHVPDITQGMVAYDIFVEGTDGDKVQLSSPDNAFEPVEAPLVSAGHLDERRPLIAHAIIRIAKPILWTPETPHLYNVKIELRKDEQAIDEVETYFGLREVSVVKAPGRDYRYIALNGKPVYLRGALHQSFHPEGVYQYPSDAVMRSDYELCKRVGINFLRIHIKAPVPRELYWADKLGVLIMQDMPNYWVHTPQAQHWWHDMLGDVIARDCNHPAIFAWVDFNETWGIGHGNYTADRHEWVNEMYRLTQRLDPTRLVEDNSPCHYDHVATDINSWHFYINDYAQAREHIRHVVDSTFPGSTFNYVQGYKQDDDPLINSEYGGIGAGSGDQDVSWCFKFLTNELRLHDKIGGYIYTELSDIEWEHNGFVNYDRSAKEFGYDFWHPGMTLADLNGADFVAIDAPPCIDLRPGERREVPVWISHWSGLDKANPRKGSAAVTLRWRVDWMDSLGHKAEGQWQSRPAEWKPFEVVEQKPVVVEMGEKDTGALGALLVEVKRGHDVVARNYVNLRVRREAPPSMEVLDAETLVLWFDPAEFSDLRFENGQTGAGALSGLKVAGSGSGRIEYRLQLPAKIDLKQIKTLCFCAELAAKAGDEKLDWPARRKSGDYPQTDAKRWPSQVALVLNGHEVHTFDLPDDPADARGVLSHVNGLQGSYGYLVRHTIDGQALADVLAACGQDRILKLRLEVLASADNVGGLAIFSDQAGAYPVQPMLLLGFAGSHGLAADDTTTQPLTVAPARQVVLPTADLGEYVWRFTTDKPADAWTQPEFDDTAWTTGAGGFGMKDAPNAVVKTRWDSADIWLRTKVEIADVARIGAAEWRLYHDEAAEVYLNGTKVLEVPRYSTNYVHKPLDKAALAALKEGENTIAVHCHQTKGSQNIDVGLILIKPDLTE